MLEKNSVQMLGQMLEVLEGGFRDLPDFDPTVESDAIQAVLQSVAERMQDNYPYHHPFYIGQMLKPPHPVARLAYMLSMWINPNNHALDGGRASSAMEKEAVAEIAAMFGWEDHLGHLTGGGTMANMEALWVSRQLHPEKKIVASAQAHYTHSRISEVLKIPFESVPVDSSARIDLEQLERLLDQEEIGTVVATLGTTATGSIDPLHELLTLQSKYGFRIHVDSAYGGYFVLADNLGSDARAAFDAIHEADSIVIDPHKHGLQPYGCGCVLFKDPSVGRFYKHDSPYTYFSSDELHLGEISLECSRAGSSAVALWATQKMFPLTSIGAFAGQLHRTRAAALALYERIHQDKRFLTVFAPELDILIWAPHAASASEISRLSQAIFDSGAEAGLHMALTTQPRKLLESWWPEIAWDAEQVTILRACLMKPEHLDWIDPIWDVLTTVTDSCISKTAE